MYHPDIKGRRFFRISIFVLLGLLILPAISHAQAKNVEQDQVRFYRSGAVLNVSEVLAFNSFGKGSSIKEITVRYNMIRSDLEADWIYNGQVIGHSLMPKGLKKSIRFTYNQPLPGTFAVRFTGAEGQVQVTNISAIVIERGEGEVLTEESEVDKQQKYDLLSKLIKINLATKRKDFKLAYEIKDHLIRRIIEKNLIDEKTIQSNISENSTIKILADKNDVTLSGQIKSQQDEKIIIKNLKEAAQEVVDVKHVKTDIHVIVLPVYTLIPFVPNVIGMDVSEAEEIISKSGFVNKVASYTSYKREYQGQEGRVVSQSPEAGKQSPKGSELKIIVYNPSTIPVPNLVGERQEVAEERIEKSGFLSKVEFHTTYNKDYQGQEDKVVLQSPEAGTQAPHGSEVIITVYSPPSIPNVIGKSQIEAEEIIDETGYLPEVKYFSSYLEKYQGQEAKVVLQRPEADRENYRGTSITITVYNPSTLVPSVVGKTKIEAEEIVEESGYLPSVEFETSYNKEYQGQEDKVVFQSPEAGTHVTHGSEVTITVYSYSPTADLEIESISYQDPLVEGEKQSFSMVVRNSGDASPEKVIPDVMPISIRVGLWYKRPGDSDWKQFQFPHTGMIDIEPGKTQTYSFQKDASSSLPSGNYLIRGIVDEHAQLNDKDVQNNGMEKEISIEPSPILLKSLPERAAWGQKILLEIETGKDLKDAEHPVSLSLKFNEMEGAIDNIGKKNWREYTLSVVVPEGATTGPISVSGYGVTGRSKDNIIIFGPPAITEISPQAAPVKSTITIEGTYFANFSVEERTAVAFTTDRSESGEKLGDVTWISENEIRVKVPDEAMSGPLSVKTIVGSIQFSTTSETSFQVLPRITGFSPKSGYAGMQAWISGTSIDLERNPRVTFNGVETEIKKISGNTLEVVVPEGASTGKIEIRTDEGIALSEEDFRVIIGPTINSISPQRGPKGTIVTIKGEDLDVITGASLIYFPSIGGSGSMPIEIVGTSTREQAQLRIPITIENWGEISVNFRNRYSNRVRFGNTSIYDADLGIESIQPQFPLVKGKKQTINLIVRNYGDESPEMIRPNIPEVNIRLGLLYKRQGDAEWMIFKNIRRGLIEIEPDKSRTFSFSLDGSNSLPGGDYIFRAFADDWEQYRDSNFQNNMLEKRITIEFDQ